MKTVKLIASFLFFTIISYSQQSNTVIKIDVSAPNGKNVSNSSNHKWLSAKSKDMISIQLINGNPFKYDYKIDTKSISFFSDEEKIKEEIEKIKENNNKNILPDTIQELDQKMTIDEIVETDYNLNQNVNYLNIEVESLYKIVIKKSSLNVEDLEKERAIFLESAKELSNYALLNLESLKEYKNDTIYEGVEKKLLATQEKIDKCLDNIIHKLYDVDLEIYTLPIDVQGQNIDVIEFKLQRFDKETKKEDLSFTSKPYKIWIRGGLKIDVSAGLFLSSLYDFEFDKRDDLNISGNKIITQKNKGEYDIAFGSMINTYIRMNSWAVPTLNFGAALTQNEKLQILFGGGLILGKQERVILTAGISMGKVDRIADSYQVGGSYNLGDSGTIPIQSEFKFGHFFGIAYNLSKVKKISLEKGIE
ncbi:hypothetical protein [Flavobacterium sp. NRK F7]|uniref:hypothetical protein n=1 Tax=Flavobacterium sp. NRK F7 TaxID=2954930 RepID=UPI002090E025|nr:hypothetical protein [Flavobacterium sp. NRK F7]MCO6163312.1 hypothetical protein [Flavobacterium sp. NRK F7]